MKSNLPLNFPACLFSEQAFSPRIPAPSPKWVFMFTFFSVNHPPPPKKPKLYQGVLFVPFKSWTSWDSPSSPVVKFSHSQGGWGAWVQPMVADLISLMPSRDAKKKKNWTYYLGVGRRGKGWQTFSVKYQIVNILDFACVIPSLYKYSSVWYPTLWDNLLCPEDRFHGRQFFPWTGRGGMVAGWFKRTTFMVHFISIIIKPASISDHQGVRSLRLGTPRLSK